LTNQEIYTGALQLISEQPNAEENADYRERASYLIATFCTECARLDEAWRETHGLKSASPDYPICVDMAGEFSCCDRFVPAACTYVASMLVLDENEGLSDRLYDRYSDLMATVCSEIPAPIEKIVEKY